MKYYDSEKSLTVAVFYFYDNNVRTFYSNVRKDKKIGRNQTAIDLARRLIQDKFKGSYEYAIIYDNISGEELEIWYKDKMLRSSLR